VPKVIGLVMLRAAALVALLGSSALTVDYLSPVPSFCGATSGCGIVQNSGWGYLGAARVPLPAVGLVGFTALLTLSLLPGRRRLSAAPIAIVGGVLGAALLLVQKLKLGVFCVLCVTVDTAAVVAAIAAAFVLFGPEPPPSDTARQDLARNGDDDAWREPLRDGAWMALGVLAVTAPLLWPSLRPLPDVPREIAAYYVRGKINVVEFVDFQCPFCRLYHPELKKVAAEYGERVNLVRLDLPLAMHPLARGAARAHACAIEQGRGDAMANALFETEDLTRPGLLKAGATAGLDEKALAACLDSPASEAAVAKTEAILPKLGLLQGLPTTFIGAKMLVGAEEAPALRDAFDHAQSGAERGVPAPFYVAALLAAAGATLWFGRTRRNTPPAPATPQAG
jgi:protein-disulfide isomerase